MRRRFVNRMNRAVKKVISTSLILSLCMTATHVDAVADEIADGIAEAVAAIENHRTTRTQAYTGETISTYTISTASDLLTLWKMDAGAYQNATIYIAPTGGALDVTGDAYSAFNGLGSEAYPFKGTIQYSGSVSGSIILKKPLFQYLSQDATVGSTLTLEAAGNMTDSLLAQYYVAGDSNQENTIAIVVEAKATSDDETNMRYSSFGGIIGTMDADTDLTLSVTSQIKEGYGKISGSGNRGFFCNTMKAGARLTITYSGVADYTVTSTKKENAAGYVGSLVGFMDADASLTLTTDFAYTGAVTGKANAGGLVGQADANTSITLQGDTSILGTITATESDMNAGGLLGAATNTQITVSDGKQVTIQASIKGKNANGGIVGSYTFTGVDKETDTYNKWDLSPYTIHITSEFTTGTYAGGVFGVLSNTSGSDAFSMIQGSNLYSSNHGATNFGGLIGFYSAKNLEASLMIADVVVSSSLTAQKTTYGGLIGVVDNTCNSFVKIDSATVQVEESSFATTFGGLVAASAGSSMFDIGTVTVSGKLADNNNIDRVYGGMIGTLTNGVLRLSGTTDLSGIASPILSPKAGQIVGTRTSALIYAMGDGANASEDGATGWTFIRDGSKASVSDVGSWGEVVRIDGTKLIEIQTETDIEHDTQHLLVYNTKAHTVTIAGFYTYSTDKNTKRGYAYSLQNFAAIALTMQCSGASGALKLAVTDMSVGWWIYLETDIDLTGTGITGLLRDNGGNGAFKGKLEGQGHTITLAVGETYGLLPDKTPVGDTAGCGRIYSHSYLGLLAQGQSMSGNNGIYNLTVDGSIYFDSTDCSSNSNAVVVYCGGIVGKMTNGTLQCSNVTASVQIIYGNGSKTNQMKNVYAGGMVGYAENGSTLNFSKCVWNGSIDNTCGAYDYYNGGYVGCMADWTNGSITISDSKIAGAINVTVGSNYARVGGLLGATLNNGNGKITITAKNVTIDGASIDCASVKGSIGGFLGYDWHNVDFDVDGLVIQNSTLNTWIASFGGLVYEASGYWKVHGEGIRYTGSGNSFRGKSQENMPSALLVCRGDDYRGDNYALYMEIGAGAYAIEESPKLSLNGDKNFDEIVGTTLSRNGNGVVSIATTDGHSQIDAAACNTYQSQLAKDYNNPYTRYYYNLDGYRIQNNGVWADSTVTSGQELLLWSVGQHCEANLKAYFITSNAIEATGVTITGDINLSGLSYYPIDYTGVVTIQDAEITFDYETIEQQENGNKQPSNQNKQHYMMQDGLFLTVTSTKSLAASITIQGTAGLTLSGTIGQLNSNSVIASYGGGSGALICGTANGVLNGTTAQTFTFAVEDSAKLVFNNLQVAGVDSYAPLLINTIGSYSALNVVNVSTSGYAASATTKAATSLLGHVGSESDVSIVLLFEAVALEGKKASTIFANAIFMESYSYSITDGTSSGTYNFGKTETQVTYGKEISNGVNGEGTTGRNPYNAEEGEGQVWYCDTIGKEVYVTDGTVNAVGETNFFTGDTYLRYVAVPEGGTDGKSEWKHEIDINQLVVDIVSGCGTYDDPYVIDTDGQLETLGKFLSTGSIAGWKINIPYAVAAGSGSVSLATDKTDSAAAAAAQHAQYTSGSIWKSNTGTDALATEVVRTYLRNAYYVVANDITLNSTFYGLGGSDPGSSVFSGVIVGVLNTETNTYPTITVSTHSSTSHNYFGGLIAYSSGSVVKNLIINYGSDSADGGSKKLTLASKAPSTELADQSFFGGVMGYVVGGDNIIDNVQVTGLENYNLTITGSYQKLTAVGAYVGLVGGSTEAGGGVVFRNMNGSAGFCGADYQEDSGYYYRNAYVGRVLDGYACAEDCTVENTDKNYKIPTITTKNFQKITTTFSDGVGTIAIENAAQLWVLSAIVNSGAGGMTEAGVYNNTAYQYGRVRTGTYENVGTTATGQDASDCSNWCSDNTTTGKQSYLVANYTTTLEKRNYMASTTSGSYPYSLDFQADCDMTAYGNGFRGIGSTYGDSQSDTMLQRTLYLQGTVGNTAKQIQITMNRTVREYASEYASKQGSQSTSGWWAQSAGLFTAVNFSNSTTVEGMKLSGIVSIIYSGEDGYIGEASLGGFAGMTASAATDTDAAIVFDNVDTEALTVSGGKYCGGLMGMFGAVCANVTMKQCDYAKLTIDGSYAAGGYFGVYQNTDKTTTIQGPCDYVNSTIQWDKDACYAMYKSGISSDKSISSGCVGAGGLFGYYNAGALSINGDSSSDAYALDLHNLEVTGPQTAYYCAYGVGAVIGTHAAGTFTSNYVKLTDVTVQIAIVDDYENPAIHTSDYFTPAAGGIVGYTKETVNINACSLENSRMLNAGVVGGYIGEAGNSAKSVTVKNATMTDCVVYTQGAASYDGASKAGGICGGGDDDLIVTDVTMTNNTVIADGRTSLILGYTGSTKSKYITNVKATGCKVATTQNATGSYYLRTNTKPDKLAKAAKQQDNVAGCAGILLGASVSGSNITVTKVKALDGFNILVSDCIVGYYTDASLSYISTGNSGSKTWKFTQKVDETTIGVYTEADTGTPYSQLTGTQAMSAKQPYTAGNLGKLTGCVSASASIKIVALSMQGQYYPYYENGYEDTNAGIHNSTTNYVIYGDYTGVSDSKTPNTAGTTDGNYTQNYTDCIAAPYVIANPSSGITVYGNATGVNGRALLTGDGTTQATVETIIHDAVGSSQTKTENMVYHEISSIAQKFSEGGSYKDNISTYFTASESDEANYQGDLRDFPVLVVDSTRSADITQMINAYISVLTNCDQTENTKYSGTVTIQSYQWDATNDRFVAVKSGNSSLTYANGVFAVNGTKHDNQNDQFTLVDIRYGNPYNTSEYYHVYMPIVVKKVLQVDFAVKMLSGSSTYDDPIYAGLDTNNAVLASYGENYTAQLRYSYTWTALEWNGYISGGGSLLWSYDKQVQLDNSSTTQSESSLEKETTRLTLVDTNRLGQGNTYFTGNGTSLDHMVLTFTSLADFQSVPINDLLNLQAKKDKNGTMKIVGMGGVHDAIPTDATVRIWNQDTQTFTYYAPKTGTDASSGTYYTISVVDENQEAYASTADVTVSEVYYLIANCTEGAGVHAQMMSLGKSKLTSTDADAIPIRMQSSGTKYYTLGDFYSISDTKLTSKSEDDGASTIALTTNDYIDVYVSAQVNVPKEQGDEFARYANNINSYFRFAIRLNNGSSACAIDASYIAVESLQIGDTVLTAKDYTGELSNGIYYITITSQKAVAYQNQTVSATVRFSYEDDAGKIAEQFPERVSSNTDGSDTTGVNFSVNTTIAYDQNVIDGSTMSGYASEATLYYREKIEVASASYHAYSTASADGNTSQLGVNGRETDSQTITSLAMYNATQISSLHVTDTTSEQYPTKMVGELKLEKKTDQTDGSQKYEQVDIGTYLQNITVQSDGGKAVSGGVNADGVYEFTLALTKAQIANLSLDQLEVDISYLVLSDEQLEAIDTTGQYANYKVTFTAHLENKNSKKLTEDASDYLIYTNAKFYLGIISVNDFDTQ